MLVCIEFQTHSSFPCLFENYSSDVLYSLLLMTSLLSIWLLFFYRLSLFLKFSLILILSSFDIMHYDVSRQGFLKFCLSWYLRDSVSLRFTTLFTSGKFPLLSLYSTFCVSCIIKLYYIYICIIKLLLGDTCWSILIISLCSMSLKFFPLSPNPEFFIFLDSLLLITSVFYQFTLV